MKARWHPTRACRALLIAVLSMFPGLVAGAERVSIEKVRFVFATKEEAARLLRERDAFVDRLSPFDRSARLQTSRAVSLDEYLAFVGRETLDWSADEKESIEKAISTARARIRSARIRFDLPAEVMLIKTTGREEGGAAYTRGAAIIFPTGTLKRDSKSFVRLFLHESFHVFSRHQEAALRDRLYAVLGFRPIGEVRLPEAMRGRRLTNPDAPTIEHALEVEVEGAKRSVVPVIYSKSEVYDDEKPAPFFRYLVFRLMVVEKGDDGWRPMLHRGEPRLLESSKVPDFLRRIGQNTGYVIHPEEVLADNFVMLVSGTSKPPATPRILEDMKQVLQEKVSE